MQVAHFFGDGIYAKEMRVPAGYQVGKHVHTYSHLSILASGRVRLTTGEFYKDYTAPACIEIKAGVQHVIDALEDSVWFCIHATDEKDASKVDEVLIRRN